MKRTVLSAVIAALALCASSSSLRAQGATDCTSKVPLTVTSASKVPDRDKKGDDDIVELGNTIELTMTGLPDILTEIECRRTQGQPKRNLVLFLSGHAMKGLSGYLPGPPANGKARFQLKRTEDSKAAWLQVLANPSTTPRTLETSVGYEDAYPFKSSASIKFRSLTELYSWLGIGFVAVLLVLFLCLLWKTGICREGSPSIPPEAVGVQSVPPGALGPFSLSKLQAAVWFFIILGSYLLIVAVTFDISGTINATALTLMGIGAATVVGAAAIQNSQGDASDQVQKAETAKTLAQQMRELKASLAAKKGTPDEAIISQSLKDTELAFKRATNQSTGIYRDIISDANGVNFHRFQMAAWTIVLAFIFGKAVWMKLAMPEFDNTLLALQGLSAGTYLGLKITEPTTPDVPKKPE